MQQITFKEKPVRVLCHNCRKETIGYQDGEGVTRIQCAQCGAVTISKTIGRRHVRLDIYAPQGQELIDDD